MNNNLIFNSISDINENILNEAENFKLRNKKHIIGIFTIAACFVFVMCMCVSMFSNKNLSGIVFTAYAQNEENSIICSEMKQDKKVQISEFTAKNGLSGFVFSYDMSTEMKNNPDYEDYGLCYIFQNEQQNNPENSDAIANCGFPFENGKYYFFYVTDLNDTTQYNIDLPAYDNELQQDITVHIIIEHKDNQYYSTITDIEVNAYQDVTDAIM